MLLSSFLFSSRSISGHAGGYGQLQYHSEGAEAVVQHAEGGRRRVGECLRPAIIGRIPEETSDRPGQWSSVCQPSPRTDLFGVAVYWLLAFAAVVKSDGQGVLKWCSLMMNAIQFLLEGFMKYVRHVLVFTLSTDNFFIKSHFILFFGLVHYNVF